jgi:hypothetical protein
MTARVPSEAKRLADQRVGDLAAQRGRDDSVDEQRIRREERDAVHTEEQDRRLDGINGHIDKFAERLSAMEIRFGQFIAVAEALEKKGVSTRMFLIGVAAVAVPLIILLITGGKA